MSKRNIHLFIIDPQNDFCDLPTDWQGVDPLSGSRLAPALPVAGAHADMLRLAFTIVAEPCCLYGRPVASFSFGARAFDDRCSVPHGHLLPCKKGRIGSRSCEGVGKNTLWSQQRFLKLRMIDFK